MTHDEVFDMTQQLINQRIYERNHPMKKYTATVHLGYYINVEVEADNMESAYDQALRQAWREQEKGNGVWGEEPQVFDLTEGESK